jgi:Natural resistance-associated macrophage protein
LTPRHRHRPARDRLGALWRARHQPAAVFSQVVLSMQLPFAVIPLVRFVSDRRKMGDFAISRSVAAVAWIVAGGDRRAASPAFAGDDEYRCGYESTL